MHTIRIGIAILITVALCPRIVSSDEPALQDTKNVYAAVASGYKGGLPFGTAFHQAWTTRLLLLRASGDIPELQHHLRITDAQADRISDLRLVDDEMPSDAQRSKLLDANIAFDEDLLDPKFYAFLDETQRELLDRLAIEFDGSAGLSRISIADRLGLSQKTRQSIASTLVKVREELYLPYYLHCFAAKLPADHSFRDCEFSGRYLTLLNQSILAHLSREERKTHDEWVMRTAPPRSVIEAIKQKSPLPEGLFGLATALGK